MKNIRKYDKVIIISGDYKKKIGRFLNKVNKNYVIVEGINVFKKHIKSDKMSKKPGKILNKNMPIHISNVSIFNTYTGKKDKIILKKNKLKDKEFYTRVFFSNGIEVNN